MKCFSIFNQSPAAHLIKCYHHKLSPSSYWSTFPTFIYAIAQH